MKTESTIVKLQSEVIETQHYHRQSSVGNISESLQEREADTTRVRHSKKDHVYAVSDDQGSLLEHYCYTAFGEPEIYSPQTENKLAGSAIANPVLWNSKRYDKSTNLYYYLFRRYKADIGRWLGRDPIEEAGGVNLYGFVGNDPANKWDGYGMLECNCKPADCNGLIDLTPILNIAVTKVINKNNSMSDVRDGLSADIEHAWSEGFTRIDGLIQDLGHPWRKEKEWKSEAAGYKYASCVKITCNGVSACIGADKISHFFQQGYMLYELHQNYNGMAQAFSLLTEGLLWDEVTGGEAPVKGILSGEFKTGTHNGAFWKRIDERIKAMKDGYNSEKDAFKKAIYLQQVGIAINAKKIAEGATFKFHGFGGGLMDTYLMNYDSKWGGIAGIESIAKRSRADHNANMSGLHFWVDLHNSRGNMKGYKFDICKHLHSLKSIK